MTLAIERVSTGIPKLRGGESLLERLTQVVADPAGRSATNGVLRTLTGPLLAALTTMRHESIEPYERALRYTSLLLTADLEDEATPIIWDARYLLGRAEALLDICNIGIDRSVSTVTIHQARRKHVPEILARLVTEGEMIQSELGKAVNVTNKQHLSNLLTWMEERDLVRRAAVGRHALVSLGPKGEAVYRALDESSQSWRDLAASHAAESALAHDRGDLNGAADFARRGLEALHNSSGDIEIETVLLYRLAEVEHDIRHVRDALHYINQAVSLREADISTKGDSVRAHSKVPTAQLYRSRASIYVIQGQWEDADADYDKALDVAVGPDLDLVRARIFNSMCWRRIRQGDFAKAENYCKESQQLWESAEGEDRSRAYSYAHLAEIQLAIHRAPVGSEQQEPSEVRQIVRQSVEQITKNITDAVLGFFGDDRNEAEAKLLLAGFRSRFSGDHEQALSIATAALGYGKNQQLALPQARAYRVLGEIHLNTFRASMPCEARNWPQMQRQLDQCQQYLDESERHTNTIEDPYESALTWRLQGVLLQIKADLENDEVSQDRAKKLFQKVRDVFDQLHLSNEGQQTSKLLASYGHDVLKGRGIFATAKDVLEPSMVTS